MKQLFLRTCFKVTQRVTPNVKLSSFTLDKLAITGKVNDVVTVTASAFLPENATDKSLTTTVADATVASVSTASNVSTFTLKKVGSTTAKWLANDGSGVTRQITITVTA